METVRSGSGGGVGGGGGARARRSSSSSRFGGVLTDQRVISARLCCLWVPIFLQVFCRVWWWIVTDPRLTKPHPLDSIHAVELSDRDKKV